MKQFRRRPIKPKHVTKFANRMRHKLSQKEMMFLRRLTLANVASFDFQIRIGFYIADFVFPAKMLILELDGPEHDAEHDAKRDRFLQTAGFIVWRIPNSEAALWPLSRITDYQRPLEGRGYVDAIHWANKKHSDSAVRNRGKRSPTSKQSREESKEKFYARLATVTAKHQQAERDRREMYAQEREGRIQIIKYR